MQRRKSAVSIFRLHSIYQPFRRVDDDLKSDNANQGSSSVWYREISKRSLIEKFGATPFDLHRFTPASTLLVSRIISWILNPLISIVREINVFWYFYLWHARLFFFRSSQQHYRETLLGIAFRFASGSSAWPTVVARRSSWIYAYE